MISPIVYSRVDRNRIRHPLQGMLLGALLTLPIAHPTLAGEWSATAESANNPFAAFPVIDHDQMAQLRGGFNIGGLELEFGANVRTLIDNVIRLETIVQLTQAGWVSSNRDLAQAAGNMGNARGSQLSQIAQDTAGLVKDLATGAVNGSQTGSANSAAIATAGNTQAAAASQGQGGGIVSIDLAGQLAGLRNLANQIGAEAASAKNSAVNESTVQSGVVTGPRIGRLGSGAQVDLSCLGDKIQGVVLNDTKGLTAAIQQFTRDRISNTVINQANNRRIDIQMNIEVNVKNFSEYNAALRNTLLNNRLLSNQNNF
ncbi:MAG: hypothetical protein J5I81_05555 [Nitrococcus mobilis]|nr:hypothetical protein [Nitrococcus mobilis]